MRKSARIAQVLDNLPNWPEAWRRGGDNTQIRDEPPLLGTPCDSAPSPCSRELQDCSHVALQGAADKIGDEKTQQSTASGGCQDKHHSWLT